MAPPFQPTLEVPEFELSKETAQELYRLLLKTRLFEEEVNYICANQTPQNPFIIGKGYLSTGQEAISVGMACAIERSDWFAQSHRDMPAHLHRGVSILEAFEQYRCTEKAPAQGRDGNVHFCKKGTNMLGFTSHMGQNAAVALGFAWAQLYNKTDRVALTSFGEGASQQGIVHEAMNYAAVFKLPVVFVINNNQWAISVPVREQMIIPDLAVRGASYGIPAVIVDGNDAVAVYRATVAAVKRARAGHGPSLIECKTFRMVGHGTHDPATYVPQADKDAWAKKDPVKKMKTWMLENKFLTEEEDAALRVTYKKEIDDAVDVAGNENPPDPAKVTDGLYSENYNFD